MSETLEMTIDERRKYLHKMRIRYWQAKDRGKRGELLDEMVAVTGMHRKSVLRLIHGELERKPRRRQRGRTYGEDVEAAIRVIAHSLDYPCAERLRPNLVEMAKHLERHGELEITPEVSEHLGWISVSTLRRILQRGGQMTTRIAYREQRRPAPNPLLQGVPMRRIAWNEVQAGHFEVDLVHHCGGSASGQYVHTLQMIDVASGWSECVAVLGRSYLVVRDGFERIMQRLPFAVRELHPDNGSEFFNDHLLRFWGAKLPELELSRSRPYHKNDNRFVEENNHSLVRAYVGYDRFETAAQTILINQLYECLWQYHNFFQPVMRLQHKLSSPESNGRIKRIYDDARPPFDRLCTANALAAGQQLQLEALRQSLNPCALRRKIELYIEQLRSLPGLQNGSLDDVRLTRSSEIDVLPVHKH
jgi:hypothetical protein